MLSKKTFLVPKCVKNRDFVMRQKLSILPTVFYEWANGCRYNIFIAHDDDDDDHAREWVSRNWEDILEQKKFLLGLKTKTLGV